MHIAKTASAHLTRR